MIQSTIIMLDNSSYSINGDYQPNRWSSQVQAATEIIETRIATNSKNSFGIGLMAGKQVQILCTPTTDSNKAIAHMWDVKLLGEVKFIQSLNIAALALKNRPNTSNKQRIVCFLGSSIKQNINQLQITAKKFKKNNIAVDIVAFGDLSETQKEKIKIFINGLTTSYFEFIQKGVYILDQLKKSQIIKQYTEKNDSVDQIDDDREMAIAIQNSYQNEKIENKKNKEQKIQQQQIQKTNQIVNHMPFSKKQKDKIPLKQKIIEKQKKEQQYSEKYKQRHQYQQNQQLEHKMKNLSLKAPKSKYQGYDDDDDKKKGKKNDKNIQDVKTMVSQNFNNQNEFSISNRRPPQNREISQLFRTQKANDFIEVFEGMQDSDSEQEQEQKNCSNNDNLKNNQTQRNKR